MKENRQGCLSRINQIVFRAFCESSKYFETGENTFSTVSEKETCFWHVSFPEGIKNEKERKTRVQLFLALHSGDDDIYDLIDAELRGIDRHIVIGKIVPTLIGVEIIVIGALLVALCDEILRFIFFA